MLKQNFHVWRAVTACAWISLDLFILRTPLQTPAIKNTERPKVPTKRRKNAQQEKYMMVMIAYNMGDEKKFRIKCKLFWMRAQVGITWAPTNCNFQNLVGKTHVCLKSRGPKNETHSYNAPVCSLILLFFSQKRCVKKNGSNILTYCGLLLAGAQISKQTVSEFNISQQLLVKIKWT